MEGGGGRGRGRGGGGVGVVGLREEGMSGEDLWRGRAQCAEGDLTVEPCRATARDAEQRLCRLGLDDIGHHR